MSGNFRRFIYSISNKFKRRNFSGTKAEKLTVSFSHKKKSPFDIKTESSYSAYQANGCLFLGVKKENCIAWTDIPDREYGDHIIEAKIRLDSLGGYAASGIIFHKADKDTYYLALVSNKGYFRLDAVKNGAPKTLIAWTEISGFDGTAGKASRGININLEIITFGASITVIVNGKWAGAIKDDSIAGGCAGFVLASYSDESNNEKQANEKIQGAYDYTCKAWLDYFSIDAGIESIGRKFNEWDNDSNVNAEERLRLAETFAVMGKPLKAYEQIKKAWVKRDEAISSYTVGYSEVRTKKELILASRMAFDLKLFDEAEIYLSQIIDQWPDSEEAKAAYTEMIKILNELNLFKELDEYLEANSSKIAKDINYYAISGRCLWERKKYGESAKAWEQAFQMDGENGVFAANAGAAMELAGKRKEALSMYIKAGKLFLKQDNKDELKVLIPKLAGFLGKNDNAANIWEVHALTGKWAYTMEDYDRCEKEFEKAEKLRQSLSPKPKADPALFYLWGISLSLKNNYKGAVRLLKNAVKLAPEYGLFAFKLAELKLLIGKNKPAAAAEATDEFKKALKNIDKELKGEMADHAGKLLQDAGDLKNAKYFFNIAAGRQKNTGAQPEEQDAI